jgi:hypothetical protein
MYSESRGHHYSRYLIVLLEIMIKYVFKCKIKWIVEMLVMTVHFCTPDGALVVRNILSFLYTYNILSQFVKPPSDTLLRWVKYKLKELEYTFG